MSAYYCRTCDQPVDPGEPSPCEGHWVGACCAPCRDCWDEAQAEAERDAMRSAA